MNGRLIDRWEYTWADIWEPLGTHPDAPADFFNEVYRTAIDNFKRKPSYNDSSIATSDPEKAQEAFRHIKGKDFKGETSVITFFEDTYEALEEFGIDNLLSEYRCLVEEFIKRYNLRYRVAKPFDLRVQLPWLYADVYHELLRLNQDDEHLNDLMEQFEDAFDNFIRTRRRRDLSTSIAKASNYAEGIASHMSGANKGTMGKMLGSLNVWPHKAVQEAVDKLYGFCSDYPGIRHSGNESGKIRPLNAKDTILISALFMAFSGYMHNQVDIGHLLK